MRNIKEILDNEAAREKWLTISGVIFVSIVVALLLSFTVSISSDTIYGKTVTLAVRQTGEGAKPRVSLELESGEIVLAVFPVGLVYKKDARAEIFKGRTLIGRPTFRVIRYVE